MRKIESNSDFYDYRDADVFYDEHGSERAARSLKRNSHDEYVGSYIFYMFTAFNKDHYRIIDQDEIKRFAKILERM